MTAFESGMDRTLTGEQTKRLLQSAPFGYAVQKAFLDEKGNPIDFIVIEVNSAFEKLAGLQNSEILYRSAKELLCTLFENDFDWTAEYIEVALQGREKEFEQYSKRLECWYKLQLYSAEKYYVSTIFTDISKRKHSESRFRTIFEESPVAIWEEDFSEVKSFFDDLRQSGVTDLRSYFDDNPDKVTDLAAQVRILQANKQSAKLLGCESYEELILNLPRYFTSESIAVFKEELICLAEGKNQFKAEIPCLNSKGQRLVLGLTLSVLPEHTHNLSRVLVSFLDITAQKQAETALLESNRKLEAATRAKSEFLANMSHEIRTPLNGVIGFSELLLNTALTKTQQEYTENANTCGRALLGIINDILDFSKIEAGKMELELTKTDIFELSQQALDIHKYQISKKDVLLLLNVAKEVPRFVWIDAVRLKQILTNLLGNAVKFTQHGEVELKVTFIQKNATSGFLSLSVRDTGIGISEAQQKQLFKAFIQADSSTTRKFGGTGLGLTISNWLAQKMGSKIEFISESGKGSTFFFTIETLYEVGEKPEKTKENENHSQSTIIDILNHEAPVILVADDVAMNRMLITALLRQIIPESIIIEAENGKEATELAIAAKPDLILMDIRMPEVDGIEATVAIRKYEQHINSHIPIIAITAVVLLEEMDKYTQAGIDNFLSKPITREALITILKKYLKMTAMVTEKIPATILESEIDLHFNKELFLNRIENDQKLFQELMLTAFSHFSSYLEVLEKAVQQHNTENIKSKAHLIKGASANMCFNRLEELAKEMELSVEKDFSKSDAIIRELKTEWQWIQSMIVSQNPQ